MAIRLSNLFESFRYFIGLRYVYLWTSSASGSLPSFRKEQVWQVLWAIPSHSLKYSGQFLQLNCLFTRTPSVDPFSGLLLLNFSTDVHSSKHLPQGWMKNASLSPQVFRRIELWNSLINTLTWFSKAKFIHLPPLTWRCVFWGVDAAKVQRWRCSKMGARERHRWTQAVRN